MSMLAQIKRRGGGRRRTPRLQAGKGGGLSMIAPTAYSPKPPPFPASSRGVLRRPTPRDADRSKHHHLWPRLRQPQDDSSLHRQKRHRTPRIHRRREVEPLRVVDTEGSHALNLIGAFEAFDRDIHTED